jgi:hypothetical protein
MTRPAARRPLARAVVVLAVVGTTLAALTGCSNDPANAVGWLKSQSGIVGAQVVESSNEELLVTGTTRGELKPGLSNAEIGRLVDAVQAYGAKHPNVTIELGHGELAFAVTTDDETATAIKLWHAAEKVPKLLTAVSLGNAINAGVLRADVGPVLDTLLGFGARLQLDAYTDLATANSAYAASGSLSYVADTDCHPNRAVVAYTVAVAKRTDVGSGQLQLCDNLSLTLTPGTSLAATAPGMRAELDRAGLTTFPVNLNNQPNDNSSPDTVDLTPGNPAFLTVLTGLEASKLPELGYELDSDGTLTLIDYTDPASTLVSLASSAGAGALPAVLLKAKDVTIGGALGQLPGLLTEATALAAASPTLVTVSLTPTTGSVDLNSAVGADPDVVTAAAALKASGAVGSRSFKVIYAAYEVDIQGGVATIGDPDYVGGEFMNQFVTAWNG